MRIGQYTVEKPLMVAPMAGVTDRPFRRLCKSLGAAYAVSEMITSKPELQNSLKTKRRADHQGESGPIAVQIAGTHPMEMARAALENIARGAQIIDINMGCPAKKVCQKWAGSALMQDEPLALSIIEAVVNACAPHQVPVTLKMRTGWAQSHKNAPILAKAAQSLGVQMLTLHGRTREQGFKGWAEYDTIKEIKHLLTIPVVANGDIDTPQKARWVLQYTKADAIMVGRAAMGRPWIFREIEHFLKTDQCLAPPLVEEIRRHLLEHLEEHYSFYGSFIGVRSARKHIGWYTKGLDQREPFWSRLCEIDEPRVQLKFVGDFLGDLASKMERWPSTHEVSELEEMQ